MKKLSYILLLLAMPVFLVAQNRSINKFYRSHKKDVGAINVSVPGWLLKLSAGIAKKHVDEEMRAGLKYVKHIKKLKVLVIEEGSTVSNEEARQFIKQIKGKGMEDLLMINDKETKVNIMMREKKDVIRNLFIFVRDDDELVMVSMKTKIKMEDINNMIKDLLGPEMFEKVEKKSAPKLPQA